MMRKRIGIFIIALVLALTAGITVACGVKVLPGSNKYTVTYYYNYDGAPSGGVYRADQVTENSVAKKPSDPSRTDYTFDGWTTDVAGNTAYAFTEKVKGNVKLYAQWTENIAPITFSGIIISHEPTKLEYVQGEELDLTGIVVKAKYSNDTETDISISECTVTGYDGTTLGEQTITVTYNNKTAKFKVTVVAPAIDRIEITAEPDKDEYLEGDELDLTGLVVTAYYKNDTSRVITDYKVEGYDSTRIGPQTITVKYEGKTAEFTVTVKAVEVIGIKVTKRPDKTEYEVGDQLDLTGMEVTVTYSDETKDTITKGYTASGYDGSRDGTYEITIKYRGFEDKFTVTVTQVQYTVTFRTGVNGIAAPAPQPVNKNGNATDPSLTDQAISDRVGYTFIGWFETGSETKYLFTSAVTKDITLTAKWEVITYTVTYIVDVADTIATAPTNGTYTVESNTVIFPTPTIKVDSYKFLGWYLERTGEEGNYQYSNQTTTIAQGSTGNKTVYARIEEKNVYNITFNYNYGASATTVDKPIVEGEKPTPMDPTPTRTGYNFGGWYAEPECSTLYNFDVNIENIEASKRVAYAKWEAKTIGVQFQNGAEVSTVNVKFDETVSEPTPEPTKTGHTFDGWHMLDGTKWKFTDKLCDVLNKETLTLEAYWTANKYSVVFKPENGNPDITVDNVTFGTAIPTDSMPADPKKTGYEFDGWYRNDNGSEVKWISTGVLDTEGLTLTAKWNAIPYTVTFNVNGGTPAVSAKTVDFGAPIPAPTVAPTKAGHTLDGWYWNNGVSEVKWNFDSDRLGVAGNITLTAKWNAKDVVVKFVDADKTTVFETQTIKYGKKATAPDRPEKEGYAFLHWHMLDGETAWNFDTPVERESDSDEPGLLTLVAHWEAEQYNVTFVMGDKAALKITPEAKYTYNKVYTLPSADDVNVTVKGYRFLGWYDNDRFTGDPCLTIPVGAMGDKTFYAYVTQNTTVDFIYNHGYQGKDNLIVEVVQGTKKADNYTPTRDGYTFRGWYTTAQLSVLYNFDDDVMVETTVYAKWEINTYTVTFDANGGAFANGVTVEREFTSEQTVTDLTTKPTRTGHTFEYWYIEDDKIAYTFGGKLTADIALKAKWKINEYTVKFNSNGGSALGDRKVNYNNALAKPNDPTRDGYTFKGWHKDVELTAPWSFTDDKVTADITLYAKWDINTYTVTFNANGGTGAIDAQPVQYNNFATKPQATVAKSGYHLKANEEWTKQDGSAWNFTDDRVTADITLYANWEINTYTVTFNANGGTAVASQTVEHGKTVDQTKTATTRTGWEFAGWNLNGSPYDFATQVTGDVTLSAVWSGKTGTYLYVSNAAGEGWNAAYTAVWEKNEYGKYQWKVAGVELYEGMQFLVVTYGDTKDTWLKAADTITQHAYQDIITIAPLATGNGNNFKVTEYNEHYNGAKWTLYIGDLNVEQQSATLSSGISLSAEYVNELRDPSNSGKTIVKTQIPNGDVQVYLRGNFTDEFSLAEAWSNKSSIIKVLDPQDSTVYTFRKVYLKKGDAFKAFFTDLANLDLPEEDRYKNCWYGGVFTGLNTEITLSGSSSDIYLGSISDGYYDIIVDGSAHTLRIVTWAPPTTASIVVTPPAKLTYWQGEPFSDTEMVVTATDTDGNAFAVTTYNISDTATNVVGKKTITVTYDGKTDVFEITVKELKVTFDSNGGADVAAQSLGYGEKATDKTTDRRGYDFGGWFDNAVSTTTPYNFDTPVTAPITLTAKWTIHQYDVKFFNDDGTPLGTVKVPYNTAIPTDKVPTATKEGHEFAHWKNGNDQFNLGASITEDLELIAHFTIESYKITFVYAADATETKDINYGGKVSKPNDSTTYRDGYTFDGWFNNAVSTTTPYDFDTLVTGPLTLTGKWTVITYTITYVVEGTDGEGNSLGTAPTQGSYTVEQSVALSTVRPTGIPNGYTFMGWFGNRDLTGSPITTIAKGSTGDRTFYASITQNAAVYLTFDLNYDGADAIDPVPVVSGMAGAALNPAPTRTGYTFKGWFEDGNGTIEYTFPAMNADKTVYAKWEINKHTVTFDTLGGSVVDPSEVVYGAAVTKPTDPTRTGYDFGGWYKDNKFNTEWKFDGDNKDTMPDADITLYAKWVINEFTVTFDSKGGSEVSAYTKVQKNAAIEAPDKPTRTGYDFGGWYKDEACETAWIFATDKVTADITLYAKWTKQTFTVAFDSNGGSNVAAYTGVEYGTAVAAPTAPTKPGYDFGGWQNGGSEYVWSTIVTGNITLTAKWNVIEYTVNYYVGEGVNHADNSAKYTVEMGTDGVVTLNDPTAPTGYDFEGWYTAAEGGTKVASIGLDDFADGREINLHAKYTIKTFTVTFNLNYTGAGTNPTVTVDYNTVVPTAKIPAPTREEYDFGGWFTDADCSVGKGWNQETKITAATTVYAKWTPKYKKTGAYLNGEFVKEITPNNDAEDVTMAFKLLAAHLTPGLLTFYADNAQITTNVKVRTDVATMSGKGKIVDHTAAGTVEVKTEGIYNIYYAKSKSNETGLWVEWTEYVAPNLKDADGVYNSSTKLVDFVLNQDGANEVHTEEDLVLTAKTTVTFRYGGTTVNVTAKDNCPLGTFNANGSVTLNPGSYKFYLRYSDNALWIDGKEDGSQNEVTFTFTLGSTSNYGSNITDVRIHLWTENNGAYTTFTDDRKDGCTTSTVGGVTMSGDGRTFTYTLTLDAKGPVAGIQITFKEAGWPGTRVAKSENITGSFTGGNSYTFEFGGWTYAEKDKDNVWANWWDIPFKANVK